MATLVWYSDMVWRVGIFEAAIDEELAMASEAIASPSRLAAAIDASSMECDAMDSSMSRLSGGALPQYWTQRRSMI